MPVKAHVHEHAVSPIALELEKWQTVATKRLRENKLAKALTFESALIRPSLMASIKGSLEGAKTAGDIKRIFADVTEWVAYP